MVTKVVAGASLLALAAMSVPSEAPRGEARPLVVRVSMPLPAGDEHGHASFSANVAGTRWRIAATCSGGKERGRIALVLAAERAPGQ